MKYLFFFLLGYICTFSLHAQADQNFQARALKPELYSPNVSLFVKGNKTDLHKYLKNNNGVYKYASNGYHAVTIPTNKVNDLLAQPYITGSDFTLHRPYVMNDTMRVRDNINPIHNGTNPLDTSYTGKGVLIAFIDTGIELQHGDFKDANGKTRVIKIWDQSMGFDAQHTPAFYGYGQVWDSSEINANLCPHIDNGNGHGTTVAGTATGNGLANGRHKGVAPEATIIIVNSDFNAANWLGTVADAVDYIYKVADTLQMPVVINASVGDYYGSHDGRDPAAHFIDSMINAKPGRLFVCAAGNSGNIGSYHVRHESIAPDTNFTWFRYNASSYLGYGSVFFEGYADTADLNNLNYAIGANLPSGSYSDRGQTSFVNVLDHLGTVHTETIMNGANEIATVDFYAELQGDVYLLQVHIQEPDSNTYYFRFMTAGTGAIDIWSTSIFGTSSMVNSGVPSSTVLPAIVNYASPDSSKIIVSSFSCGQNTILTGNYYAMQIYTDYNGNTQNLGGTVGNISVNSSRGPSRDGRVKPEIAASGDIHMSAAPLTMISTLIATEPHKVDQGGMHIRNGGTSMASPVVAGIGALALQKCPNLTAAEFRNMLTSTAQFDLQTGITPNMSFGYGKVDGFEALVQSNFTMGVALNTSLCPGDSVELLIGPGPLNNFLWSTGDTSSSIWATDSAYFSVEAHNQYGCKGRIDSILTSVYSVNPPTISIDTFNLLLVSSPAVTYQWVFDGDTIVGATSQTYDLTVYGNGFYEVYVTDANGCTSSLIIHADVVGIDEMNENPISFYPNPTRGMVTLYTPNDIIHTVRITDATGKWVYGFNQIDNPDEFITVDMSRFSRGIYFIEAISEKGSWKRKVVKE